jgi:CDP-diacylglycerol--glycerol-3-phosphate 3-phosphatidyltransferase
MVGDDAGTMLKHLPNALTLLRLVLAPVVAWLFWLAAKPLAGSYTLFPDADTYAHALAGYRAQSAYALAAAVLFAVAALTDLFDGMAARAFNAHSKFGRIIDPIADKALVGLPLIVVSVGTWHGFHPDWLIVAIPTAIIVTRDIGMTIYRLASPDGEGIRVSSLAKWKTALELIVVGALLVIVAVVANRRATGLDTWLPTFIPVAWLILLAVAAALSAITAIQYLAAKKR